MCEINHEIILNNIKNNDIILHELCLVKGFINNLICSNNTKNNLIQIRKLEVRNSIQNYEVSNIGEFKILLQLLEGDGNNFQILYCNSSYLLNLKYHPINLKNRIQPVLINCVNDVGNDDQSDEQILNVCKKIQLNLKLIQLIYSEKLFESNLFNERKTFQLLDCIVFNSKLKISEVLLLAEIDLWNKFAYEIINSPVGSDANIKFCGFIGCTKYEGYKILNDNFSYKNIKLHTKGHAALGGGGLALFSTICFYCWPKEFNEVIDCFKNTNKINLKEEFDESNYRRTYSGCYATTLGAVCHELGHCFDLGHTKDGIMGNGFDYINLVFVYENKTEHLPNRIVEISNLSTNNRLTKVKNKNFNDFLSKYQEQKSGGDSTFFTENCCIILANHKWFNIFNSKSIVGSFEINFNVNDNQIYSTDPIILIEIRDKSNGLVMKYFDYSKTILYKINLPKLNLDLYNIFSITKYGNVKLFQIESDV